jgi:hypothetical protein
MAEVAVQNIEKLENEVASAEKALVEAEKKALIEKAQETNVVFEQFEGASNFVVNTVDTFKNQVEVASIQGSEAAKSLVNGLVGDNKANDVITSVVGTVGGVASAGGTIGLMPLVVMFGAAKGIYTSATK